MKIQPFILERYFAKHEFSASYLLSCSDAEPLSLSELLQMADAETLDLWETLSLGYTESRGHPLLLETIKDLYHGIAISNVLEIVPEEGIFIAMHSLLEKGDHVIVTHPGYQSLYQVAISIGCEVSWWEPRMQSDMAFHIEDLSRLISPHTKLIVVNFPHNPTGALIDKNSQSELINIARENDIMIFSDEMYRFAELDPADRLPAMASVYEKGISLGGMSKSLSLPGLRVGWLVSQYQTFMRSAGILKDYTTICAAAPSEILALIALRSMQNILNRNIHIYKKNLSVLADFFQARHNLFRWIPPRAGTVTFPEYLAPHSAEALCQTLLEKSGVMLVPASALNYEGNFLRIGYGRRDMPEVLGVFDQFLSKS
jgi:aspartate/methionine/tyrosine aminotransferase